MKFLLNFLFLLILFLPGVVRANVSFSEVAWMGTSNSQYEEWIELYNDGSESVSLSGWKIFKAGGSTSLISLSGNISAGQYLLVCRTTSSLTNPLSGACDVEGSFGGSGLNNSSEHIILKNSSGSSVDSVNATSGWPAGESSTRKTMQKSSGSWITADPTPGSVNASSGSEVDDTNDDDTETDDDSTDEDSEDDEEDENNTENESKSSSKLNQPKYTKELVEINVVDSSVPVGSPVKFSLKTRDLNGANILRGDFFWNMGDGTERFYSRNKKFEHVYDHEGTYIVTLKYYSTFFEEIDPDVVDKFTITINNSSVVISKIHADGSIELKNSGSQEVDLSDWSLRDEFGKIFSIPDGTYIAGNKNLVLNSKRTRLNPTKVTLLSPSGSYVGFKDKFESQSIAKNVVVSSTSSSNTTSDKKSTSASTNKLVENDSEDLDDDNLNSRLQANTFSSSNTKQKQPSLWIVVFVILLIGSSVFVFFLYKRGETEELNDIKEEDDFELID